MVIFGILFFTIGIVLFEYYIRFNYDNEILKYSLFFILLALICLRPEPVTTNIVNNFTKLYQ